MKDSEIYKEIGDIAQIIEDLKHRLLNCQLQFGKNNNWDMAETTLTWAKRTDELHQDIEKSIKIGFQESVGGVEKYPYFVVQQDGSLQRVALNRDKTSEYKQSISKSIFDSIIAFLDDLAEKKGEFTANDLKEEFKEHPDYVVYLVLSFLKEKKLVRVPSRGQYKFISRESFQDEVKEVWKNLEKEKRKEK